jgi:hypothetical protein
MEPATEVVEKPAGTASRRRSARHHGMPKDETSAASCCPRCTVRPGGDARRYGRRGRPPPRLGPRTFCLFFRAHPWLFVLQVSPPLPVYQPQAGLGGLCVLCAKSLLRLSCYVHLAGAAFSQTRLHGRPWALCALLRQKIFFLRLPSAHILLRPCRCRLASLPCRSVPCRGCFLCPLCPPPTSATSVVNSSLPSPADLPAQGCVGLSGGRRGAPSLPSDANSSLRLPLSLGLCIKVFCFLLLTSDI